MDSTRSIIRLWRLCTASAEETVRGNELQPGHSDGAIPVDVLRGVLQNELNSKLADLGCASVTDILKIYFGASESTAVGFLEYWKGMEAILAACGVYHRNAEEPTRIALEGFRFFRDCVLELTPDIADEDPNDPRDFYAVRDLRFFLGRAAAMSEGPAADYWRRQAERLPGDDVLVTSEEVGSAMLTWLESLTEEGVDAGFALESPGQCQLDRFDDQLVSVDCVSNHAMCTDHRHVAASASPMSQEAGLAAPVHAFAFDRFAKGPIPSPGKGPVDLQRCTMAVALLRNKIRSRLSGAFWRWNARAAVECARGSQDGVVQYAWGDDLRKDRESYDFDILEELVKAQMKSADILERRLMRTLQFSRFLCCLVPLLERLLRGIWSRWRENAENRCSLGSSPPALDIYGVNRRMTIAF